MEPDEEKPPPRELTESSSKMRMYLIIFLGSSYCAYRLQKHWREPLHWDSSLVPTETEITYKNASVTGGLLIAINDEEKVAIQCSLHSKSPECTSITAKETCPCMLNWPKENNVMCLRFSPVEKLVSSANFQRTDKGYTWTTTWKLNISPSEDVKAISELIRMKNEAGLAKQIPFGGVQFTDTMEFHGNYSNSEFQQFMKIRFNDDFKPSKDLGGGSFGAVQMCTCRFDGKVYAIKVGKPLYGKWEEPSEVTALSVLRHENVVNMICAWCEEDASNSNMKQTYILMECCDMSVANILPLLRSEKKRKDKLFHQFMAAVQYLHAKGVIHRDLKPENVLLRADIVKLADFGDAALKCTAETSFQGSKNYGSKNYTAPELNDIFQKHTEKVDMYGSGVVYYLLHSPRSGETFQSLRDLGRLAEKVKTNSLLKTDELFHEWTGDFDMLKQMVDYKPEKRITAHELLDKLVANKKQG